MDGVPQRLSRLGQSGSKLADPRDDTRGRRVIDSNGEEIGRVVDLIVDRQTRTVVLLEVLESGFLGLGTAKFLVPAEAVVRVTPEVVRVDRDRDQVAAVSADSADFADEAYLNTLYASYGYQPFWTADEVHRRRARF
jgi:sporulation protein YlmC with PRC-barrel domain